MVVRPWAVAVIGVPSGVSPARAWARVERVRTAIDADVRRCTLLDLVEFTGDPDLDEESFRHVELLARTYPVQGFLINGVVDPARRARLEELAATVRILTIPIPPR